MENSRNISRNRNLFLAIGIIVGVLIFLLGSQLNANLSQIQKQQFHNKQLQEPNPIIKKFFS
ncbi:hypothetical protein [Marivirga sp.]|uniref:hypothetical protein n=1 Tax=Marivirga sp. TaxID=2018662 RepID=UPI002D7EAD03|nr:hypothetical protein [Marivirga sp.]HET8859300.1 hypothetical protein [Marivirga sp.]